jgi:uncharacterized membrane protein
MEHAKSSAVLPTATRSGNAAGASSSAAAAAALASASRATRQYNNEMSVAYFAIAMLGFIVIFSIFHWTNVALVSRSSKKDGPIPRAIVSLAG